MAVDARTRSRSSAAYGYTKEYPVEKLMRDAKLLQIYEGTNQIQRDGDRPRAAEGLSPGLRQPARPVSPDCGPI